MTTNISLQILRKPQVMTILGLPLSTLNLRVKQRLVTVPLSLGARSVGWPSTDIEALVKATCTGSTEDQLKALVLKLERQRSPTL